MIWLFQHLLYGYYPLIMTCTLVLHDSAVHVVTKCEANKTSKHRQTHVQHTKKLHQFA